MRARTVINDDEVGMRVRRASGAAGATGRAAVQASGADRLSVRRRDAGCALHTVDARHDGAHAIVGCVVACALAGVGARVHVRARIDQP